MSQPIDLADVSTAEAARDKAVDNKELREREKLDASADGFAVDEVKEELDRRHLYDPSYPNPEERSTLRRVPGSINALIFSIAVVEFAERFSYYGFSNVMTNFIQQPMPPGSTTGAIKGLTGDLTAGALGKGQRAAFGISTFNTFWIYTTPIAGAIIADTKLGRYRTIFWAIGIAIIGHIGTIISAVPGVINKPNAAFGIFVASLVVMGMGTGPFKSNISPLIAEQAPVRDLTLKTLKSGEKVIIDPSLTTQRIMLYFYVLINLGSLSGQIGMVFAENDIGFWLSYTIPTIVLCLAPLVMLWGRKRYVRTPPTGSVFLTAMRALRLALKKANTGGVKTLYRNIRSPAFWENIKPSHMQARGEAPPVWMATIDDLWVDQLRRGLKACTVFIPIPLYWLSYNQMTGNLTSQAATMTRNGVPNDLINNLNPISLVILIPIFDQVIYPLLRKRNIHFSPIKRMTCGFFIGSLAMVVAAVIQHYIYQTSPCGNRAATCDQFSPINVWVQTPAYVLIGISEIFTSVTGLEYAFTKAPESMRSFVTSIWLFQTALSAALGQAFVALSGDPLLVVNYSCFAGLAFVGGIVFWLCFRSLDKEEMRLNDMRRWKSEDHQVTNEKSFDA